VIVFVFVLVNVTTHVAQFKNLSSKVAKVITE